MSFSNKLLIHDYFPKAPQEIPFGQILNDIFFNPRKDNLDYPLHGPNVIRFVQNLVECKLDDTCGLLKSDHDDSRNIFLNNYPKIIKAMDVDLDSDTAANEKKKITELLKVAALFHDIGKYIRRENHPQIGTNLLRNFDESERKKLLEVLIHEDDHPESEANHNRFSLISSIIQHHDKFGVVSTGEGALPIFSDILYFTSNSDAINGIKKNVTSVMLLNLADIAAVNIYKDNNNYAKALAFAIGQKRKDDKAIPSVKFDEMTDDELTKLNKKIHKKSEKQLVNELAKIFKNTSNCLGLPLQKMTKVIEDWKILINAIEHEQVAGNRVQLKKYLMGLEKNPSRTIRRILRILQESAETSGAIFLQEHFTPTSVEAILVGTLGAHQFQIFCEQLATIVKFDYGLNFFKAIVCACVRNAIVDSYSILADPNLGNRYKLTTDEINKLTSLDHNSIVQIAEKICTLIVEVLEGLVNRYEGVLDYSSNNPRRFGFQMRNLSGDVKIRDTILDFLCIQNNKDPIALTWIADEVTIWSMD